MKIKRKLAPAITTLTAIIVIALYLINASGLFDKENKKQSSSATENIGSCSVHFIDVGQGDSTLISCNGVNVLIDAGENNRGDDVLLKLIELNISKLDYVIGTHAHSDHIGGLDTVINSVKTDKIVLSDLPDSMVPNTKTYTDLLNAIVENNVELIPFEPNMSFDIGGGKLTLISPNKDYKDHNDLSIISRFTFSDTSFLFTGDAEEKVEEDLLDLGIDVSADVLKVGHHGSETSSSQRFISAVKPKYAVIEVGTNNQYGHPSSETLERFDLINAKIYRTDLNGDITAVSDGKNITFSVEKE